MRSGRFRFSGPCVARQSRLHGPPPRPHARRPPCAPSPGTVTENVMCGRVGRRSGGRSAHPQRTARHTRSPAKQSTAAPGATGNLARVQRPQARQRGTGNAAFKPIMRGAPCRHCRAHRPQHRKTPCEGGALSGCVGAVEPLKPGVPTVPQPQHSRIHPRGPDSIVRFMAQW